MQGLPVIKLDQVKKSTGRIKEYSIIFDEVNIQEITEHIALASPINIEMGVKFEDDLYFLTGQFSTNIKMECSRCLEEVILPITYSIDERLSIKPQTDKDIIILEKEELDLLEIVREGIEFAIPKKVLCSKSCLGLCPLCGCNLNISKCRCKGENIDPRLAVLKDLFKE